jgi:hypothetical protein
MVRHLSNNLDNDAAIGGGLRINGVNEDFAVFEPDGCNLVVNFLWKIELLDDTVECANERTC